MSLKIWFASIALLVLSACNPIANMEEAEIQIEEFHAVYSDKDIGQLYAMVGPKFREETSQEEFVGLISAVHSRLGPVVESKRVNFKVNSNNGTTFTVIIQDTKFELGEGQESFTFIGHGEDLELAGWHVNSQRLLMTPEEMELLNSVKDAEAAKAE